MLKKYFTRCATFVILVSLISPVTHAEALLTEPLEKEAAAPKKQLKPIGTAVTSAGNVTPISRIADTPQLMSCWQYGKLILEQTVIAPKDKVTDIRLMHNPATGAEMLAFDFKNAFCFIK